ncbi:MAG: acetolactate synthase small subunit [Planctomycetota bacterium]|jgi:acetolactate synthase-1/3 small subunit|nr:acetolactate synthase small subunit [Planctomycetota bacterium]
MPPKVRRHVFSALVENKPGVLARIASLFSARGYNIESLNVGETDNAATSRMTISVLGDDRTLEQIRKQLSKLIDTLKVTELSDLPCVETDLALVKVKAAPDRRGEILNLVTVFNARIADVSERHLVIEISGNEAKLRSFLSLAGTYGVTEMVRAGRIAMKRGD